MVDKQPILTVFVGHIFDQSSIDDLRAVISNATKSTDWKPVYADEKIVDGHILTDKIIPEIQLAEFCLFEISDRTRPNIFFELGIAKGMGKPCILLIKSGCEVPSDLGGYDRLIYASYKELERKLRKVFTNPPTINSTELERLAYIFHLQKDYIKVLESGKGMSFVDDMLKPASRIVSFLGLCGNPVEATAGAWDMIHEKADMNCQFRLLYMKPTSKILKLRSGEEDGEIASERLSLQAEATLQSISKLRRLVRNPSMIQLRHYNRIPTISIIHVDNHIYTGPYLFGARGVDSTWFEILQEKQPIVFNEYLNTFERLWKDTKTEIVF
jgi:hypothetical protein